MLAVSAEPSAVAVVVAVGVDEDALAAEAELESVAHLLFGKEWCSLADS